MDYHLSSPNPAFTSNSHVHCISSHSRFHSYGVCPRFRRSEISAFPARRVRNGSCQIRLSTDESSQPPSSPFSPSSSASGAFSTDKLLEDLRNDGGKEQALALVTITRLPSQLAFSLIKESGVLNSRYRKTRIAALYALGTLKLVSQTTYLADILENDSDYSIRAAAAGALSYLLDHSDSPLPTSDSSGEVNSNRNGLETGNSASHAEADNVREVMQDDDLNLAARTLRRAAIDDDHFMVRYSSIVALGTLRDIASVDMLLLLVQRFATPTLEAAAAIDALGEILRPKDVSAKVLTAVRARATDTDDLIRAAVARTFDAWRAIPEAAENLPAMLRNEVKLGRSAFVLSLLRTLIARGDNA